MRIQTTKLLPRNLEQIGLWLVAVIIVLVPFHAFLTVWLSSILGHYTALRLWKEVLLAIVLILAVWLVMRSRPLRRSAWNYRPTRWLIIAIGAYVILHIVLGIVALTQGEVTEKALGYAFISNLRYPLFLIACLVIGFANRTFVQAHWQKLLLWPAAIVVGFGLLQILVLPVDWLKHVGYGPGTIEPYIAVDQKVEFARAQSTLRGPNPLGAYLLLVLVALAAMYMTYKKKLGEITIGILLGLTVLYSTYSRSAWLGLVVALAVLAWLLTKSEKARKIMLVGVAGLVIVGAAMVYVLRDNDYAQNVLFHTDETSQSAMSSNEGRANAILDGVDDIANEPLGRGPGTAGPASVYNDDQVRNAENYFIQIGQEVGVLGLGLFVVLCGLTGFMLWRLGNNVLAVVLLAGLAGLTLINVLSHAWADDTISYLWWGLTGLAIGAALTNNKQRPRDAKETI